jgi:hypothetical protein
MRFILPLVLALAGCAVPTRIVVESRLEPVPSWDMTERKALLVETPTGSGSAWPITGNSLVTCWHVVSDVGAHEVVVDGRVPVQILSLEPLDAALLVFESSSWEPFPVDDRYLEEGERVSKSGWGAGLHWYTEGIATEDPGRVGMSVAPGDSGCPVFIRRRTPSSCPSRISCPCYRS